MARVERLRIAIGGVHIESSTFSPHRSTAVDFDVRRGPELLAQYQDLPAGIVWVPLVHARALPGGVVERSFYDAIATELLERLRDAGPLDGVFLDIHGAMSVEGMTDVEGAIVTAAREIVGPDVLISAAMDPHGNVSRDFIRSVSLATSHRMSPHEDAPLTKRRAIRNLVESLRDGIRPLRAWCRVPVLLPGERACTRDEPARSIYGSLPRYELADGIIDAAIWIGYAWADEPRCGAAVVVSGTDRDAIAIAAREIAQSYWANRAAFDNPTAGGGGDAVFMLERLLANESLLSGRATAIWASVVDPSVVAKCVAAGEGATLDVRIGGVFGSNGGASLRVRSRVERLRRADHVGGDIALLRCGGVQAIVTSRRKPYHLISDFTDLGVAPERLDLIVVKIGYLVPELFAAAKGWVIALTPGGVDQDIVRLGYRRIERPMYPFDPDMPAPPLEPVVFG
ncbi:MAG: M81 family metallopeptidase [Chloroflexi bacterium]|nr:MAG: M81 family metallopeptidase [Chloroflexota bacterium]